MVISFKLMVVAGIDNLTATVHYKKCHIILAFLCSASIFLGILLVRTRNSEQLIQENDTLTNNTSSLIIHYMGDFFDQKIVVGKKKH
jgi:hypothetical protein